MKPIQGRTDILDGNGQDDPVEEVLTLARIISPQVDVALIARINIDTTDIFRGKFPGFRVSNPTYHNLRHTRLVALAVVRLFHGLWCDGRFFAADTLIQGFLSACFHDTGMLLTDEDSARTGARYTRGHEERSITFVRRYIQTSGLPQSYADNCAAIIRCTELNKGVDRLRPYPEEIRLAGHIVGSADILAQMADRYYLERLPLLFHEQKAGYSGSKYHTPVELMQSTADFYRTTISHRLNVLFSDVSPSMRSHFREHWQIDEDLYTEAILKNIGYLESVITRCKAEQECVKRCLRRVPPAYP
jgi:hypothetical protein